jgi:hypothetical protein
MMKDDSPAPQVPEDGTRVETPAQADWPVEQIKEFARELYIRFPFDDDDDDTERWKDLVREAFIVFDKLDEACKEILRERSEERKAQARERHAYAKLSSVAPFDRAVRYITGEKRTERALRKLEKVLSYEARIIPFEGDVSPKLSVKERRQIDARFKRWRENGIRRAEALQLQSRFERYWPLVVAEQNSPKARRRGGKHPVVERRLQMPLMLMSKLEKQRQKKRTS